MTVQPGPPPLSRSRKQLQPWTGRGHLVLTYAEVAADHVTPPPEFPRLRNRRVPVEGVQVDSESTLTRRGKALLENFLALPLPLAA